MNRSDDELRKASYAVYYEFDMMRECMTALGPIADGKKLSARDKLLRNALLESFLIHLRNLLVFLHYVDKTHPDDVRAAEFVKGWSKPGSVPSCLTDAYLWVCVRVAHLSYARQNVTDDQRDWPVGEIHSAIKTALKNWYDQAPRHLLDAVWKNESLFAGKFEEARAPAGVPTGMIKF